MLFDENYNYFVNDAECYRETIDCLVGRVYFEFC